MVPSHVENRVFIIDVCELFVLGLPQKAIKLLGETLSMHYPGTLEKIYCVNSSRSLDILWKVVTLIVDPEIIEKVVVLRNKDMRKMTNAISREKLEKKFGGCLEDIKDFWPPSPSQFNDPVGLKELVERGKEPPVFRESFWIQIQEAKKSLKEEKPNEIEIQTLEKQGPKENIEDGFYDFKEKDIEEKAGVNILSYQLIAKNEKRMK